ncbi:vacuolar protein sorting-associated family 26 protein [Arthrobacter sp. MDB2-24]
MLLTRSPQALDISLLQRGTEGTAALGHSTPVTVEIRASHRVRMTSVQFTLVHSLSLTRTHGNPYGGTFRAAERTSRDIGSTQLETDTTLRAGESCCEASQLIVPADAIPTLHGKLITSTWSVRVRVSSEGNEDLVRHHPLTVHSGGTAGGAEPGVEHFEPSLRLAQLSTHSLYPGGEISGVAEVSGAKARALTLSIVMQEEVMSWAAQRPQSHSSAEEVLVEETVLSGIRIPLTASGDSAIPFTLAVPAVPAPTVKSPLLEVRWLLRAVLDVPFRRDPTVLVPLVASTVPDSRTAADSRKVRT